MVKNERRKMNEVEEAVCVRIQNSQKNERMPPKVRQEELFERGMPATWADRTDSGAPNRN